MAMIWPCLQETSFIYAFETAAKAFALTDRADLVGKAISILANKAGIYGMIRRTECRC